MPPARAAAPPRAAKPIYAPQAPRVAAPKPRPAFASGGKPCDAPAHDADAAAPPDAAPVGDTADGVPKYGCPKCRFLENGCAKCLRGPTVRTTWAPSRGIPMDSLPPVPTFRPSEAEWADPVAYVASIRPVAERVGIARIVPPPSWKPPFSLPGAEQLRFPTRIQAIHELQNRQPGGPAVAHRRGNGAPPTAAAAAAGGGRMGGGAPPAGGRMGGGGGGGGGGSGGWAATRMGGAAPRPQRPQRAQRAEHGGGGGGGEEAAEEEGTAAATAAAAAAAAVEASFAPATPGDGPDAAPYGFRTGERHTLASLERYSRFFKARYFAPRGGGVGDPSLHQMEAEFWRLVESTPGASPRAACEVVYGADIQTGEVGSGFPCASTPGGERYATAPFNVCNMPFNPGSALRHVEKTTGISVPWLYFGMTLSAFCWHVEDHHLYSVNCLHWGDPKVWYSIPASHSARFEAVMRARLPDLFESQPGLLHALVTLVSPATLIAAGIPVHRAVQEAGDYIITFPFAYHAGFNAGFNCAEATNFAPADWLPFGGDAAERYSTDARYCSIAHDKMMVALGEAAQSADCHPSLPPTVAAELDRRALTEVSRRADAAAWAASEARMSPAQQALCDDTDCSVCLADLHVSALFCECSPSAPTCLRHAGCGCSPFRRVLAFRYTLEEMAGAADAARRAAQPGAPVARPLAERFGPAGETLPPRPLATREEARAAFNDAAEAARGRNAALRAASAAAAAAAAPGEAAAPVAAAESAGAGAGGA